MADPSHAAWWPWWLLALSAAGTYLWRGLGVVLAGRLRRDSWAFEWITCVTYAMLAGLVVRVIVLPVGMLADTPLVHRLLACGVGLAIMLLPRGGLLPALLAGTGLMMLLGLL